VDCGVSGAARRRTHRLLALALCVTLMPRVSLGLDAPRLATAELVAQQAAEYRAQAPKTIVELQQFRSSARAPIENSDGRNGEATLTNLNPYVNAWYLLTLDWGGAPERRSYHLENPRPLEQSITLLTGDPHTVRIAIGQGGEPCTLWPGRLPGGLGEASATGLPYAPLCSGRLYLRNPVAGRHTSLETVTEFLRDYVWGGEQVVDFVKQQFYRDAFLEEPATSRGGARPAQAPAMHAPLRAAIGAASVGLALAPQQLGLDLAAPARELEVGEWYRVRDLPGVYLSVVVPEAIDSAFLSSRQAGVNSLDHVESKALVYMVAFDLQAFDLRFALGPDHPRLGWSVRVPPGVRIPSLPGPDGIDRAAPLVSNGMVSPADVARTVATFTGGFKREHGAFHYGPLSEQNHGSHYGFIEQGVVFSKLQPGLATVFATDDGVVELKTWSTADDARLAHIRYARQNGVPLIQYDPARGVGVPGAFVNLWGPGNWSGSATEDLRTLRAGLCLQAGDAGRFLLYGYFSDATPSAMARVFQAYRCQSAMHLDMNALEHTYLALYVQRGQRRLVEHLIQGMDVLDQHAGKAYVPRFLGFPDNRDFFFLTRRGGAP